MMCGIDFFGMRVRLCSVCSEGVLVDDVRILFIWMFLIRSCCWETYFFGVLKIVHLSAESKWECLCFLCGGVCFDDVRI